MDGNVLVQPDLGPLGHTSALLRFGGNRHERHTFVGEEESRGCSDPVGVRNSSFIPRLGPKCGQGTPAGLPGSLSCICHLSLE